MSSNNEKLTDIIIKILITVFEDHFRLFVFLVLSVNLN